MPTLGEFLENAGRWASEPPMPSMRDIATANPTEKNSQLYLEDIARRSRDLRPPTAFERAAPNFSEWLKRVPDAFAAFIGPKGARNLAAARIRHPDDWGGLNRLAHAQEHPDWGMPDPALRRSMWEKFGWEPPNAFGTYGMGKGAQPLTMIATPEFGINQAAMRPMKSGQHTVYRAEGKVPELLTGMDEVLTAEPSLRNPGLRLTLDPSLKAETGGTMPMAIWKDNVKRLGEEPIGWRTSDIFAHGYDEPSLLNTARHEVLGHAVAIPQGVTPTQGQNQKMFALRGSHAENQVNEMLKQLDPMSVQAKNMEEVAAKIRSEAGYRALAEEIMARARATLGNKPLPELKKLPPSLVDTYQPGALGKGLEALDDFPLAAFRPPWLKKPE